MRKISSAERSALSRNPNVGKRHGQRASVARSSRIAASPVTVTRVSPQTLRRRFRATGAYGK